MDRITEVQAVIGWHTKVQDGRKATHIYTYQKVPIHTYIHKHPFQHIHLIYGRSVAESGRSYRNIDTNIIDNTLLAGSLLGVNPSCGTHLYNFDQTHRSQNNIQNENKN